MVDIMKAAKEKFPANILISLVIGIVVGYFVGSYVGGGVGGAAIGTACVDSDGGLNYDVAGKVTFKDRQGQTRTKADRCRINNELIENYCESSTIIKDSRYICQYGCSDGACKSAQVINATCTDSDGGKVSNMNGSVRGTDLQGRSYSYADACDSITAITPVECIGQVDVTDCEGTEFSVSIPGESHSLEIVNIDTADRRVDVRSSTVGKEKIDIPYTPYVLSDLNLTGLGALTYTKILITNTTLTVYSSSTEAFVTEFYCDGNQAAKEPITCLYACNKGACS